MDPPDGNAMAGQLLRLFGREMTAERERRAHCEAIAPVAEREVSASGPGAVPRCGTCHRGTLVITDIRTNLGAHLHLEFVGRPTPADRCTPAW